MILLFVSWLIKNIDEGILMQKYITSQIATCRIMLTFGYYYHFYVSCKLLGTAVKWSIFTI